MTDDDTYDIELPDATPRDFAAIVGGVGLMQMQLAQANQMPQHDLADEIHEAGALIERLLTSNREAARSLLLEADGEILLEAESMVNAEVLDELGLRVVGNEFVDADGWEDIDVE